MPLTDVGPADLVLRDLVDALIQENVWGVGDRLQLTADGVADQVLTETEAWYQVSVGSARILFRGVDGGPLQRVRLSRSPVWHQEMAGQPRPVSSSELLRLLPADVEATCRNLAQVAGDLDLAVEHAEVTLRAWDRTFDRIPRRGMMLPGERLAATRNRPFHPTARAATGWSAAELDRYGPMRRDELALDWVAVRRDLLVHGSASDSARLDWLLLDGLGRDRLAEAARATGVDLAQHQPVPVHPWQFEHVLHAEFGPALAAGDVVPLARGLGSFRPTSSLRTLVMSPETDRHVKLPLGVATLGAARLLPPRYLENSERAERLMRLLLRWDPTLADRVELCDERTWCGWRARPEDEFSDRAGQLAAQVRSYPPSSTDPDALVLPMAALAAHDWSPLDPALREAGFEPDDPVGCFGVLADAFCAMALGFLRYGVLPELHGQNVVVVLGDGAVRRFVLRDHDTLRLNPRWMGTADVPDPGYRVEPGAPQSLIVADPADLLGYLQTLGFQVNLYGIADALARHRGLDERALWSRLRLAVVSCLERLALPDHVTQTLEEAVLKSPRWPARQVLGPLLSRGRSSSVSMPAAVGQVPNPFVSVPVSAA